MRATLTFVAVLTGLLGIYFGAGPADMRGGALIMAGICSVCAAAREVV